MRAASRLVLLPAGLALVTVLGACGSSAKPTTAAAGPTTTTTTDPRAAYNACLSQHGVNLPARTTIPGQTRPTRPSTSVGSPPPSRTPGSAPNASLPPGVTQSQFNAARQACQNLLPASGNFANGRDGQAFTAYTQCLAQHGVTVPTTTPGSTGGGFAGLGALRNDPNYASANQACMSLLPTTTTTAPAKA